MASSNDLSSPTNNMDNASSSASTTTPHLAELQAPFQGLENGNNNEIDRDYFRRFPPGYRFCPYDHELVVEYLSKKINKQPLPKNQIVEVNIYRYNPQQLAAQFKECGEKEWYFFTPRERKYPNGSRPKRAAGGGYWKATGADKKVDLKSVTVGFRKALVFYEGKPPNGIKTSWIMHEYRINDAQPRVRLSQEDMTLDDWVLCKIYNKVNKVKNTRTVNTDYEDNSADEDINNTDDFNGLETIAQPSTSTFNDYNNDYIQEPIQNGYFELPPHQYNNNFGNQHYHQLHYQQQQHLQQQLHHCLQQQCHLQYQHLQQPLHLQHLHQQRGQLHLQQQPQHLQQQPQHLQHLPMDVKYTNDYAIEDPLCANALVFPADPSGGIFDDYQRCLDSPFDIGGVSGFGVPDDISGPPKNF